MRPVTFEKEALTEKERRNVEILELLRRNGPISRPDISKETGINIVTISSYIDNLIKHNLVCEKELDVSEGGRRPELLDLNPQGGYIIGVGLNLLNMVGVLLDLKGNIILKTQIERPGVSVGEVAGCLLDITRNIIKRSKGYDVRGIGVGIAGIVNKSEGSVCWPERISSSVTNYASVNIRFKDLLEKEFDLPVIIENDATSACFGERWLGLGQGYKNVIYMFSGVGCGIVINGEVYRGSSGYAGEVSVYSNKESGTFDCAMGPRSCYMKRWDLDMGVVDEVKEFLAKDKEEAANFFDLTSCNINNVDLKNIFIAAKAKDRIALRALELAARRIGIKVAYLVNLLNPQLVVIGGGFEEAGEEFINKVSDTVKEWAFREATENLKINYSLLRENAVALGAASLVMQRIFAQLY